MESRISVEPGVSIYINDINKSGKETILFIHGWPANNLMFEYQFNKLPALGFRCIGFDTRGFGKSDKPWDGYDYDRLADDLKSVVDSLELHNFTLLGHSTGGAIAARYMGRHKGHEVSKLVLCAAAAPSLIERPNFPYGQKREVVDNIIQGAYADRPNMLHDFGNIFFYNKVSQPFSDWFFNLGLQAASWSTIAIANDWLKEELFYDLASINVPTLIMHGIHGQVVPYPLGVIQNQMIKNSKLMTFKNSGHGLFYDEKDKFNRILSDFAR